MPWEGARGRISRADQSGDELDGEAKSKLMAWFAVCDSFPDHPKVNALLFGIRGGKAAGFLWTCAGAWSKKNGTEGVITKAVVRRFGFTVKSAEILVKVGLWEVVSNGWSFHDWDDFQGPDASQKSRDQAAERQRRKRDRDREPSRDSHAGVTLPLGSQSQPQSQKKSVPTVPPGASAPPSMSKDIAALEEQLGVELCHEAHDGCSSARKHGKMGNGPWLRTLQTLVSIGVEPAREALAIYVDNYCDGDKREEYLLQIARRKAKGNGRQTGMAACSPPEKFTPTPITPGMFRKPWQDPPPDSADPSDPPPEETP